MLAKSLVAATFAAGILAALQAVASPTYSVTELSAFSRAYDINNGGDIVGRTPSATVLQLSDGTVVNIGSLGGLSTPHSLSDARSVVGESLLSDNYAYHAFLYSGGAISDLGTLGGADSVANGINSIGHIVGWSKTTSTILPFVSVDGSMTALPTLGGSAGVATAINDAGVIVGSADTAGNNGSNGPAHAFAFISGSMIELGTLGGPTSSAYDINNNGWIVGSAATPTNASHAFLYRSGSMVDLGTLGGEHSSAADINIFGVVVGQSWMSDGTRRGFVYVDDALHDLSNLLVSGTGWTIRDAIAINDRGQIIAEGCLDNIRCAAVLLDPTIPEPGTVALLGLGLAGLAATRRRKCPVRRRGDT